jgi:hypothetical protein
LPLFAPCIFKFVCRNCIPPEAFIYSPILFILKRISLCPKDIQIVTGRSERYARYLAQKMRIHFKKEKHQLLTIQEMCVFFGLDYGEVSRILKL